MEVLAHSGLTTTPGARTRAARQHRRAAPGGAQNAATASLVGRRPAALQVQPSRRTLRAARSVCGPANRRAHLGVTLPVNNPLA